MRVTIRTSVLIVNTQTTGRSKEVVNSARGYRRGQRLLTQISLTRLFLSANAGCDGWARNGGAENARKIWTRFHHRRTVENMTFMNLFSGSGLRSTFAWRIAP